MNKTFAKFLTLFPCVFCFIQYFTILKEEQRTSLMGIAFLIISILYFFICLYFLIKNWNG
ncbi:MAG: hypothetical protein MRERV_28c007 [Mycoplasmataceae bacterium RV_VA103A]|nr:MAG: hypothetical protein MRERV_28c007 [Mycoplasmataceae bacterium RV_VA103A]